MDQDNNGSAQTHHHTRHTTTNTTFASPQDEVFSFPRVCDMFISLSCRSLLICRSCRSQLPLRCLSCRWSQLYMNLFADFRWPMYSSQVLNAPLMLFLMRFASSAAAVEHVCNSSRRVYNAGFPARSICASLLANALGANKFTVVDSAVWISEALLWQARAFSWSRWS